MGDIADRANGDIRGAVDFSSSPDLFWLDSVAGNQFAYRSVRLVDAFPIQVQQASDSRCADSKLTLAADVSLHNRTELTHLLRISRDVTDKQILAASYEKWGEDCAKFLLGEFAFAVWNDRTRQLFCCRDQLGFRPFFYWHSGSRFAFASSPRSILALPDFPKKVNTKKLAGLAVLGGAWELHDEDTFHDGIQSLPYGCSLTVTGNGIRKFQYWVPEIRTSLVPKSEGETFEALRELLFSAVECRIPKESDAVVELSGGLDSSGITAIAARHLESKGRALLAVAGVLPQDTSGLLEDEREYIDEFRSFANVRIEYVSAAGRGPFDALEHSDDFISSPIRAPVSYLHDAFKEVAIRNGARVQLRGMLGELGPSCSGGRYFVQLAAHLRWFTLARELATLQKVQGTHPFRYLAGRFLDLRRGPPGRRALPGVFLTPEFLDRQEMLDAFRDSSLDQRRNQLAQIRRFLMGHATWRERVLEDGIRFSYPWLDKRVLEFCLAAPPALKVRNGYDRYLMRAALDGILPKKIQWRTSKTPFSPDYFVRYNSQLGKALEFLNSIGPKDPIRRVIEIDRLHKLVRTVDPQGSEKFARDMIPRNLYAICFLRQFPEFRP